MMILPWLQGIVGVLRAPGTWLLVLLNVLFAVFTFPMEWQAQREAQEIMTEDFLETSGKIYAEFLAKNPQQGSQLVRKLARGIQGHKESSRILGNLGIRDPGFLDVAPDLDATGDRVVFEQWKTRIIQLQQSLAELPSSLWGLSTSNHGRLQWFSHAFIHAGYSHLLGNMYFLLIFGAAVEIWLGTIPFLLGFFGGGLFSAVSYLLLQGDGGAPMVGASGAISAVMGMYCVHRFRQKVPFAYIVLPIPVKALMGTFLAPAGIALIIWALQDLTGLINTPTALGGVAHAAHLGGFGAGLVIGLVFKQFLGGRDELQASTHVLATIQHANKVRPLIEPKKPA